jgi:ElaB/YqjD/DUF883 family membrane-anchored ribosome-binding protein
MFGRSYPHALSSNLRELERRLLVLEGQLQRIGSRTSGRAALAAEGVGDAIASTLSSIADRFRGAATSAGSETARMGDQVVRRLSVEVENRPLITIAVAVGVGILVGLALQRRR